MPKIGVLKHGENTTLTCNLTKGKQHQRTGLKRISWYKDGIFLESIRIPDPDKPLDSLGPLVLNNNGIRSRDGGNYSCFLQVELRSIRMYNVSDSTMVESKCTVDWPWWRGSPWLQLQPSPLVFPCQLDRFHGRDVCSSMTEIPYWWRKVQMSGIFLWAQISWRRIYISLYMWWSYCLQMTDNRQEITKVNKYLLLAEFSVRVNYGPSFFFPSIYGPSAKRTGP